MRSNGSLLQSQSDATGVANINTSGEYLDFGPQLATIGGTYTLECRVPARDTTGNSGIVMYTIVEAD